MQRLTIIILLLLTLSCSAVAEDSPFNVDVFFGWDGYYRPSEWTPVVVGVSNNELQGPFSGSVRLSAKQDGLNTMNVRQDFVLTKDIPQNLPMVTKFAFTAESCDVTLVDMDKRRRVWSKSFGFWDYSTQKQLKTVHENDMLIGLVGKRGFNFMSVPKKTQCSFNNVDKNRPISNGKVCIGHKMPWKVPWDWTGFASLDLLVLYSPDWSEFKTQQLRAISQWVTKGGKLLLIPGPAPISADNPLTSILPYAISDGREVTLGSSDLSGLKLGNAEPEKVFYRPVFTDGRSPLYRVSNTQGDQSLFVSANAGFGTVGILTIDPDDLSAKHKNSSDQFWVNCITMMLESKASGQKEEIKTPKNRRRNYNIYGELEKMSMATTRKIELVSNIAQEDNTQFFSTGLAQAGSNAVLEYLYNIAEMRPLGILPVIFLLLLLAVLVGPVDYIVLKRKGMLPMTWLTSAFWIVLFSFGAYHGVQALRGGKLQMRHVSVIDAVKGAPGGWRTNYSSIFAHRNDDYELIDEREDQWFSAIAPVERQIYIHNRQRASKQIHCMQSDGSNKPYSLPINIWTMQCLINESPAESVPINAAFSLDGDEVTVTIDNFTSDEIKSGYILFDDDRYLPISSIGPKEMKKEFSGRLKRGKKWDFTVDQISNTSYATGRFVEKDLEVEKVFSAQGCLERSRAIKDYLSTGAAVVCVRIDDTPVPYKLKKKGCEYKHIELVRLVIFPEQNSKDVAYDQN